MLNVLKLSQLIGRTCLGRGGVLIGSALLLALLACGCGSSGNSASVPVPQQHSAALSWTASTTGGVAGYNVYRSTVSGGPYTRINTTLQALTNYDDLTVQAGQTYYYVVTAVNGSGVESVDSNQVTATIPQ
jgi:opacity protein-like surface antigen